MFGQPFALGCPKCGNRCPIKHVVAFADRGLGLDGFCVNSDCPNDGTRIISSISAERLEDAFTEAVQWDADKHLNDMEQPKKPGEPENPWFP